MKHVERHIIQPSHPLWLEIDRLCFLAKNLYNYANYLIRQSFIFDNIYLGFNKIYHLVKGQSDYQALPRKVSQQVLRVLDKNWQSFFEATKAYQKDPSMFTGRPKLPKYKHKTKGRNLLTYTIQAISKPWLRKGIVKLSGTDICIPTQARNIAQTRIIPKVGQYVVEIVFEQSEDFTVINSEAIAAIDIGVSNLATLTSNLTGFKPILVNGRPLKSINQFYNKQKANYQSKLPKNTYTSNRLDKITKNRNNKVDTYLHQASRWLINHLDKHGISTLVIGKNPLWKQEVNTGKANNQTFTTIPHARFIEMLQYKGELKGITVICTEESYTSKASFLALDDIPSYNSNTKANYKFSGYRESRGQYKQKGTNVRINADVNGSYNIMRKVFPKAFAQGIEGCVVSPFRVTPNKVKK